MFRQSAFCKMPMCPQAYMDENMPATTSHVADKELTILLTLKDRAAFTFRWMSFADQIGFPFKVLIADGGSDESVPKVLSDRASFPNVNYEYIRYPYDESYTHYYSKVADALSRVNTPFVAMADNDDFFSIKGLRDAAEFLLTHPDYVSCGGRTTVFRVQSRRSGEATLTYGDHIERQQCYELRSVTKDTARERIFCQFFAPWAYYDVRRTEEMRRQSQIAKDLDLKDIFLHEHLLDVLTQIAGKTKRLEGSYLARQINSSGSSAAAHTDKFGDLFGRMLVPTWSADFANFLGVTSNLLANVDGISVAEARQVIIKAYRIGYAPEVLQNMLGEPSITARRLLRLAITQLLAKLPAGSSIKEIVRNLRWQIYSISLHLVTGSKLISRQSAKAQEEFEPIVRFLVSEPRTPVHEKSL